MTSLLRKLGEFAESIKIAHSIFALPFAIAAAFLASEGLPNLALLGKIVLAVVLARTGAMAFNRLADATIDAANPRTEERAIPAGRLSRRFVGGAALLSSLGFVAVASWINSLAFALSPIVLVVLFGYSFTKRFTSLSHIALGVALGLSPLGAWVAVRAEVAVLPALLGLAVICWTAGFDIIYACQDREFDVAYGLRSIPARWGVRRALVVTRVLHVASVGLLAAVGWLGELTLPYWVGVVCVGAILAYENSLVRGGDLSRVNLAFFTLNGVVSLVFMTAVVLHAVL